MKALILVGGFGTRLRPLTFTMPKPLVPFGNMPIFEHQIAALADAGVDHIILAINYQPDAMLAVISELEEKYKVKITCSKEDEPMGTAGPIRLAKDIILEEDGSDCFFVFNSDVICNYPLKDMLSFHKAMKAEGTIAVTRVEDPSRFGVVVTDERGCVERFVEKPKKFVGDRINAGLYVLSKSVVDRIPPRPTSIERVTFPELAEEQKLFALTLEGYWADVGQPKDFTSAVAPHIEAVKRRATAGKSLHWDPRLNAAEGVDLVGDNIIHPSAVIGKECMIGPNVVIGPGVKIENGSRISNSTVLSNAVIGAHCCVSDSIVGWASKLGRWSKLEGAVLGEDVQLKPCVFLNGTLVLPHKEVAASVTEKSTILM